MTVPKDVPIPTPGTCEYVRLRSKGELSLQVILRLLRGRCQKGVRFWIITWPKATTRVLKVEEGGGGGGTRERLEGALLPA